MNPHERDRARRDQYRAQVRETMRRFSDQALAFQDSIIRGGIECDREIARRQAPGRCPGCGVVKTPEAEHLNDCPYQGQNALPL